VLFPFDFLLIRPTAGGQSDYSQAARYLKWARGVSWALAASSGITLVGYVVLYSDSSGRFCTEHFDQNMQLAIFIWTGITGITFSLLVITATLQSLTRRLSRRLSG
jgi:prolipoprotein diacylglyceryltransferase